MKDPIKSLMLFLCLTAAGWAQRPGVTHLSRISQASQQPAGASSALDLVSGYRDAAAKLQNATKVPPRLPTWVPYDDDKNNPVFASVATATSDSYVLELSFAPDCNGAGFCHLGTISGSASPLPEDPGPKIPVVLNGGLKAYFIDSICAANCSDSAIFWTDAGNYYSIGMKAEKQETLIKMVNSAIGSASQ